MRYFDQTKVDDCANKGLEKRNPMDRRLKAAIVSPFRGLQSMYFLCEIALT